MSDITTLNPTRQDLLDSSILLLELAQDVLGRLAAAMRGLPETRDEVGTLFAQFMTMQDGAWHGLATYLTTMDCEGNS